MTTETPELDGPARTRDAHVAALNANDADGWVACFTPDAVQMPPNDPANVGTANILAWSTGMLSTFDAEFALDVDESQLVGEDWAFERGSYDITLTAKSGGERIRDRGKYITIYTRGSDGRWLMARDIWNSVLQRRGGRPRPADRPSSLRPQTCNSTTPLEDACGE